MPKYRITHVPDDQNVTETEVVEFDGMSVDEHGFAFHNNYQGVQLYVTKSGVARLERIEDDEA